MFFASGLDEAPAGQTYQGWLINSETDIRSAGLFQANADGTAVLVVSGDLPAAQAFAITLEPDGGSAQPTVLPTAARGAAAGLSWSLSRVDPRWRRRGWGSALPRERWSVEAAVGGAPTRVPR